MRADVQLTARAFGVSPSTVRRWKRQGIPARRIDQMAVHYEGESRATRTRARPRMKVEHAKREGPLGYYWLAAIDGAAANVRTPDDALSISSALYETLSHHRFPLGTTFQWVIEGVSTHEPHEVVSKPTYNMVELKPRKRKRGKPKERTKMTLVPIKPPGGRGVFGRLDVAADSLMAKLLHLEPFFKAHHVSIKARKSKALDFEPIAKDLD